MTVLSSALLRSALLPVSRNTTPVYGSAGAVCLRNHDGRNGHVGAGTLSCHRRGRTAWLFTITTPAAPACCALAPPGGRTLGQVPRSAEGDLAAQAGGVRQCDATVRSVLPRPPGREVKREWPELMHRRVIGEGHAGGAIIHPLLTKRYICTRGGATSVRRGEMLALLVLL